VFSSCKDRQTASPPSYLRNLHLPLLDPNPHPRLQEQPIRELSLKRLTRILHSELEPPDQLKDDLVQLQLGDILPQTPVQAVPEDHQMRLLHPSQPLPFGLEPPLGSEQLGVFAVDLLVAVDAPRTLADGGPAGDEGAIGQSVALGSIYTV
jgi:hypothetical protein